MYNAVIDIGECYSGKPFVQADFKSCLLVLTVKAYANGPTSLDVKLFSLMDNISDARLLIIPFSGFTLNCLQAAR